MALSRAHTSAEAADVAKSLLYSRDFCTKKISSSFTVLSVPLRGDTVDFVLIHAVLPQPLCPLARFYHDFSALHIYMYIQLSGYVRSCRTADVLQAYEWSARSQRLGQNFTLSPRIGHRDHRWICGRPRPPLGFDQLRSTASVRRAENLFYYRYVYDGEKRASMTKGCSISL